MGKAVALGIYLGQDIWVVTHDRNASIRQQQLDLLDAATGRLKQLHSASEMYDDAQFQGQMETFCCILMILKLVTLKIIYQHGNSFSSVLDTLRNPRKSCSVQ